MTDTDAPPLLRIQRGDRSSRGLPPALGPDALALVEFGEPFEFLARERDRAEFQKPPAKRGKHGVVFRWRLIEQTAEEPHPHLAIDIET